MCFYARGKTTKHLWKRAEGENDMKGMKERKNQGGGRRYKIKQSLLNFNGFFTIINFSTSLEASLVLQKFKR